MGGRTKRVAAVAVALHGAARVVSGCEATSIRRGAVSPAARVFPLRSSGLRAALRTLSGVGVGARSAAGDGARAGSGGANRPNKQAPDSILTIVSSAIEAHIVQAVVSQQPRRGVQDLCTAVLSLDNHDLKLNLRGWIPVWTWLAALRTAHRRCRPGCRRCPRRILPARAPGTVPTVHISGSAGCITWRLKAPPP